MFEKLHIVRLMRALHLVFISIRYRPDDPIHKQVLITFQKHFTKTMNTNDMRRLITDIKGLKDHEYKISLVSSLKRIELKTGKFTLERISKSIPVIQDILEQLILRIEKQEFDRVRTMASAVHNYPDFLIDRYRCSSEEFWQEHINYYSRKFNENFLEEWEYLFKDFYPSS